MTQASRYDAPVTPTVAQGWTLQRLTPPSRLFGANGICRGPDDRLYVAQVSGSQVSAIDVDSGDVEIISPKGGDIVAPDDLVFDPDGNLYATEITEGRVCVRTPAGRTRIVLGDMPCANPIAFHQGRLYAGECRVGGRIMELDLDGGAPRVLVDNVPMPNAMEVGPDGLLYFPVMGANEIWRVPLSGGQPEVVAAKLGVPDAVKFDARGHIVSTQVGSGQVLRIDPGTGERTVLADIAPGLDNLAFIGERLFVSSISGQVNEIIPDGEVRSLVPDGLNWPLGLAVGADGSLFVADGGFTYSLNPGVRLQSLGMLFTPGFPGYTRGVVAGGEGEYFLTSANGHVARWSPAKQDSAILAEGFEQLYGIALTADGAIVFADRGAGRVLCLESGDVAELASGLDRPSGVAVHGDTCLVAEEGAGRVLAIRGGNSDTLLDGLVAPQGLVVSGSELFIVDAAAQELIAVDLAGGGRRTLVSGLPVGAPAGVVPKFLGPIGELSGPMGPFAGIAAGSDGTLYLSADAEGSVMALRPGAADDHAAGQT